MSQESTLGTQANNRNKSNGKMNGTDFRSAVHVFSRREYLERLRTELSQMSKNEIDDIIRDQEEYIHDAVASGRSEQDVVASLGDPKIFAASLLATSKIQKADQATNLKDQIGGTMNAIFAILALAPLNLIFVLGPFLTCTGLLFGGWAGAMGLFAGAVIFLAFFFVKLIFVAAGFWVHLSTLFFAIGMIGASLLALVAITYMTKWFLKMTIVYLKWNLNFIQGRK